MQIRFNNDRQGAWSVSKLAGAFLGSLGMLAVAISAPADNFTTTVQQPAGNNWNQTIWNPGGVAPAAGNTYEAIPGGNPTRIRPPTTLGAGVDVIFPGDSLTIDAGAEIRFKRAGAAGAHIIFPGVGGNPGLIMNGGNLTPGDSTAPGAFHIDGIIQVNAASTIDNEGDNTRVLVFDAEIRGSGMLSIVNWTPGANPITITHANNPYTGTWSIGQGGNSTVGAYMIATSAGSLGTGNILVAPSATLEVNYDINTPGFLRLDETHNSGGSSYGVFVLHQNCTFAGVTINGTVLAPGVYTYAALRAAYPGNIPAGGSGGITVSGGLQIFPTTGLDRFLNVGPNRFGYLEAKSSDLAGENYVITGGGDDQWDRGDAMAFAYHEIAGDFDIRVQVAGHTKSITDGCCPKAAIMSRDSLAEDSKHVMVSVGAQNMNNNLGEFLWRTGVKDVAGHDGGQYSNIDAGSGTQWPNNWIRLTRVGSLFTGYSGYDGQNWVVTHSIDSSAFANGPLKNRQFVGLTVSKHDGPDGETSRAVFEHYSESAGPSYFLAGADSHGQPNMVRAYFTHAINFATLDLGGSQFSITGGPFVDHVAPGSTPNTVDIFTAGLDQFVEGSVYGVLLNNGSLLDTAGNSPAASPTASSFLHGEGYESKKIHLFHNADGNQELGDNFDYYNQTTAVIQGYGAEIDIFVPHADGLLDGGSGLHVFEGESGSGQDNLGTRIVGVLSPTTTGDYKFATATDDTSNLYLSSDDQPSHQNVIANIPQWAGSRAYLGGATSASIHLIAGQARLLDLVSINGGGGFNTAVTWDGPTPMAGHTGLGNTIANGDTPIAEDQFIASRLANGRVFYTLGPATVTGGPANVTSSENVDASFSVAVDGTPPYTYQWKVNGAAVLGATAPTFTLPNVQGSQNNAHISVCVSNLGGGMCSPDAILTVIANPVLTAVGTRGNCHALYLTFSKNVKLPAIYTLDNGISVTSSNFGVNNREVVLHLSPDVVPDITYTLTVKDLQSFDNFTILPNPTVKTFVHGAEFPLATVTQGSPSKMLASQFSGGINYKRWNGFDSFGNNAAGRPNFLDQPAYLTQPPDISSNGMAAFESPWTNDAEHYGNEYSGTWVVPRTGVYRFWCASDDQSMTFISTDNNPADMVTLCSEPQWVNYREYLLPTANGTAGRGDPPINRSIPYSLTAGQLVYLQADHLEGTGGDHYALTYAFGRTGLGGESFTTLCDVFCNPGPSDQSTEIGLSATFSFTPDGTPPYNIQWYSNGVAIAGATGNSITTPPVTFANNNDVYTVTNHNFFSTNGCGAVLHVLQDVVAVSATTKNDPDHIYVLYNVPVSIGDGSGSEYTVSGADSILVQSVAYNGSDHRQVIVATDPLVEESTHTLTIVGVKNEALTTSLVPAAGTNFIIIQGHACHLIYDFTTGLPFGTTVSGNTPPFVGTDKSLHLTRNGVGGEQNYWTIALPSTQTLPLHFSAHWKQLLNGLGGADGMSFSAGVNEAFPVAAEEGGNSGLAVTVDTYDNGGGEVGIEVRWNGAQLALTKIGGGGAGNANGPAELEKNTWVDAGVNVAPDGTATFTYDGYVVSALIPGYTGITANQYVFGARTGGASEDCWIDDVCINDNNSVLGPANVVISPHTINVPECQSITIVGAVSGSPTLYYQWYKDGVAIPGAIGLTYTTPAAVQGPDITYSLKATNLFSSSTDATVVHTVVDNTAPVIVSVGSLTGASIGVQFSEAVDPSTATDRTKYSLNGAGAGLNIAAITLRPDGKSVIIVVSNTVSCTFTVSETGVLDLCPARNSTTSSAVGHRAILTAAQDIGFGGDPAPDGTTTVEGDGTYELTAGGSDIWGTDDHGQFAYTSLSGSFDVQVKVTRLDFLNTWSKAGIMARQSLDAHDATINTYFTPTAGANGIEAGVRQTFGGGTGGWGGCGGAGCDLGDTPWIRMQRISTPAGEQFIGYHAPDAGGSPGAWVNHADTGVLPAGSIPSTLLVGLMLTSHNNGNATTADYTGLKIAGTGTVPSVIGINGLGQPIVTWPGCGHLQGTATLIGSAGGNSSWTDITGASPVTVVNPALKYFRIVNP